MTLFLSLVLVLHLLYYVLIFRRVADAPIHNAIATNQPKITLLICFKDEVDRVDTLMEAVLSQSVDDIVLADDLSSDGTYEKLLDYKSARVQVIRATMDRPGKKQVMQDGLAAAKYDRILVTDADCVPASDDWSAHMNNIDKPLTLGYGPMTKTGTLTNQFSRFETYLTAMQYIGYALWGRPYMGVGRNMIIDRKLRYAHRDRIKGKDLASGDDDLTINAIATAENTGICLHPDAFVVGLILHSTH